MEVGKRGVAEKMPLYECLLFDLDDTLYPKSSGLSVECTKNIGDYVAQKLGVDRKEVTAYCRELYKEYGTTMAGLRALGYDFDYDDYHSYVHGRLPYENLKPDPVLKNLLLSMPQRKIIFTNSDKVHAAKVLSRLGLEDCFEGVICFETLNSCQETTENNNSWDTPFSDMCKTSVICKPSKEAIERVLVLANADPKRTVFFDDSHRNIAAGKHVGLHTILVGTSIRTEGADLALESIHNVKEALPAIWEGNETSEQSEGAVSIETVVNA